MFIVTGFHFKDTHMSIKQREAIYEDKVLQVDLENFVQVGQFATNSDVAGACREAFDYFNWTHCPGMQAPAIANDLAKFYDTHASMCVGDVIQITSKCPGGYAHQYFVCMPEGWGPTTTKI